MAMAAGFALLSPEGCGSPAFEQRDCLFELASRQPKGLRIHDLLDKRGGIAVLERIQDIANRQPVGDDEHERLGSLENPAVGTHIACDCPAPALPAAWRLDRRFVGGRPFAVVGERVTLEAAEADVVQLRQNEARDLASGEREVGGLANALELTRHAEIDLDVAEPFPEPASLLLADRGQGARDGGIAVDCADDTELALAVAGEDHLVHLACLRSSAVASRRMKRTK